jgi:hypothetical protein
MSFITPIFRLSRNLEQMRLFSVFIIVLSGEYQQMNLRFILYILVKNTFEPYISLHNLTSIMGIKGTKVV